jgi:hypothetical protein
VKERFIGHRPPACGRGVPWPYGRPGVPTIPVPIPVLAGAALLAAFVLGRASGRRRWFAGGPCRVVGGRGPHFDDGPSAMEEEAAGA